MDSARGGNTGLSMVMGGARGQNRLLKAGRQLDGTGTGSFRTRPRKRAPRPFPKVLYSRGTPGIMSRSQPTANGRVVTFSGT